MYMFYVLVLPTMNVDKYHVQYYQAFIDINYLVKNPPISIFAFHAGTVNCVSMYLGRKAIMPAVPNNFTDTQSTINTYTSFFTRRTNAFQNSKRNMHIRYTITKQRLNREGCSIIIKAITVFVFFLTCWWFLFCYLLQYILMAGGLKLF